MKFRRFSVAVALAAAMAGTVVAAPPMGATPVAATPGTEEVTPFRTLKTTIKEDADTVRMFFSFSCPHCYQAHDPIVRWGSSLPTSLRFEVTPVVTKDAASLMGAAYYYAVKQAAPLKLAIFSAAVYEGIQRQNGRADQEVTYLKAAARVGIDTEALKRTVRSEPVKQATYRAAQLVAAYALDATPSVTTGGRYVVTPEATQGINGNFFQLVNAVTSKHMIETGRPG
ncbi:MAG: thiol:disulfide interchange protein DsbA/DsbL [Sulfuritalea sp.]|nr:thiol:disulfide interchange protein DsbA/DsbL [Sulfuritalea sp.]